MTLQDSPGALLCSAKDGRLFSQHLEVIKPAKAVFPLLYLHWLPLLWCLWGTALSKIGGEHREGRHMVKQSCDRAKNERKAKLCSKMGTAGLVQPGRGLTALLSGPFQCCKMLKSNCEATNRSEISLRKQSQLMQTRSETTGISCFSVTLC